MEVSLAQAVQLMEQHYQKQDFSALEKLASEIIQQRPEQSAAWRFLGIATLFGGGDGATHLLQASVRGDSEARIWLNVLNEFLYHPKESIEFSDFVNQVSLMRLRKSAYMEYPAEVHIETHAICNAKCSFCPYPTMDRQGDKMPDELIDKIINDMKVIPASIPFQSRPLSSWPSCALMVIYMSLRWTP